MTANRQFQKETPDKKVPLPDKHTIGKWIKESHRQPTVALYEAARYFAQTDLANALNRLRMICAVNGRGGEPTKTGIPSDKAAYETLRDELLNRLVRTYTQEEIRPILDIFDDNDEAQCGQTYRTKTLLVGEVDPDRLSFCPNIHKTGSVIGMKEKYWGMSAKCVRCGDYIYNVDSDPELYALAH